ncbi:MAG TPA: hypothetical protein VD884_20990 [Ohtaekwangia sp.]|nr:hypothetical protein [Ohtaekwangia sp.]
MDNDKPKEKELPAEDLHDLENEELSGSSSADDAAITETDEDEDEGLGDGNMNRSDSDPLKE